MPSEPIERSTLDDLKRRAAERAGELGHHLGPFRSAKRDHFSVSFCLDCRQMVIVTLEDEDGDCHGSLHGYALEVRCVAPGARSSEDSIAVGAR